MVDRLTCLFAALLVLCLTPVFASAQYPRQVQDDRGVTVSVPRSPQRIVSLFPSLTESVCALGQCQRLVGVDRYSNHPASVLALPNVGGGLDPNIEAVVALQPDLVVLATSSRAIERLESLGLKVLALQPKTHAEVGGVLERLGHLLEVDDAQRVWRAMDAAVMAAAQALPQRARNQTVYFEVSDSPHAASEASFIGETLSRLGARNIVPGSMGPFPKLNPEFIVRADPDVMMVSERNARTLAERPGWRNMRAIKAQKVCAFSADQYDVLVRSGPRLAEGARLMAKCLSDKAR